MRTKKPNMWSIGGVSLNFRFFLILPVCEGEGLGTPGIRGCVMRRAAYMLQSGAISCLRIVEKEKLHFRASGEVFYSVANPHSCAGTLIMFRRTCKFMV
jgi:hypothetical protein